ncbi:rod shape-determining protein [Candidatus Wirthbacteria bacterium CG2_30_54_11]|uniref:Cell shape-determining protein MreB n=1 Tax=Candidatus Wirthbacteria bacterium CG2_30_54_11 TaxID=1817892 RepID=A0A1J5IVW5_9BACT|nr:MAG: rod shape-determining protein [Candidatus Wirthbacteria bacterium CG2_30_54_11]
MFTKRIGIDLGTANVIVYVSGKGIAINEPSVVAISDDNKILAVGKEAKEMLGKTPGNITASRPMRDGVIADYVVTEAMLRYFINKVYGSFRLFRPEVMICVPTGVTSTERRAVLDAAIQAGARAAYLIEEPLAAAIGAGIPIAQPSGSMIIDMGGGTTGVAVISLGGVVVSKSVRVGGNKLDEAISNYVRRKYNLMIGEQTAEEIKIQVGSAMEMEQEDQMEVRGRDLLAGLPRTIYVKTNEVFEAIQQPLTQVINTIRAVLEQTPPELSSDIVDKGIVLSGGGALLRNMDQLIMDSTQVSCYVAEDPLLCVAKGTGAALEHLDAYKKAVLGRR